jgi:hypothetical protein
VFHSDFTPQGKAANNRNGARRIRLSRAEGARASRDLRMLPQFSWNYRHIVAFAAFSGGIVFSHFTPGCGGEAKVKTSAQCFIAIFLPCCVARQRRGNAARFPVIIP